MTSKSVIRKLYADSKRRQLVGLCVRKLKLPSIAWYGGRLVPALFVPNGR